MHSGFKNKTNNMQWFSLTLDELSDVTNTVQLLFEKSMPTFKQLENELVYEWCVWKKITEENILKEALETLIEHIMKWTQ